VVRRRALVLAAALLAIVAVAAGIATLPSLAGIRPVATATASASALAAASPTVAPTPAPSPSPSAPPPPEIAILDRSGIRARLQAALDKDRVGLYAPGMVATVLFADGTSWSGTSGVADLASGRPLSVDTPFSIASISKTFLAAEVLDLVVAGSLRLEDSAARLLPGVPVGGRPLDPRITIRELLDHTSGLRDYLIDPKLGRAVEANPRQRWTPAMALAYAGKPLAAPGAGYHYSNTNYVLLGLIVERLTGRTLAEEFRTRFFGPLGLRSASYQGVEAPTAKLPTSYRYASAKRNAIPAPVSDGTSIGPFTSIITAAGAAGSVAASAPDLARWARALYGGDVLAPGARLAMISDADTTLTLKPGYPYGLGVQVYEIDGRISYGHSGRLVGARSAVRWFPEAGLAIAVVTNESRFDPGVVVQDLLAVVAPRTFAGGFPER
jgi:D-alanyl-D-alanine carboxypeptidase